MKKYSRDDEFTAKGDLVLRQNGFTIIPEECFIRKTKGWRSRPDGIYVKGDLIYQEELKTPAEFGSKSWLSTYKKDPIAPARKRWRNEHKRQQVTREEAENRIVIQEADDHYTKRGKVWDYPAWLNRVGKTEKLVIRYPNERTNHIKSLNEILSGENRHPEVISQGADQIIISFDPPMTPGR